MRVKKEGSQKKQCQLGQRSQCECKCRCKKNDEARHDFAKSIMWRGTDFLRPVIGEVRRLGQRSLFFCDDAAERKDHITGRRKMSTPERKVRKKRASQTTSSVDGVGPSAPMPPRRSRRDMANARAEEQARREPHWRSPRLFGSGPHDFWLTAHLGLGQQAEELTTLLRPSPTNFAGEDHQPGAPVLTSQFRIARFLEAASSFQSCSIFVRTPRVRCPVPAQDRHESGVHPNLGTVKQGKAVSHDFQPTRIGHVRHSNFQVANCNVATSFATRCCTLQGKTSATQHPHVRARLPFAGSPPIIGEKKMNKKK